MNPYFPEETEQYDDDVEETDFGLETERDSDPEEEVDMDAAFERLIEKFKALYDTSKHSDVDKSTSEMKDRQALFDSIFDQDMERYLNGEQAGGYEDVLEEALVWADDDRFIFRAFRYKRLGADSFDQYVRFSTDDDELIVQSKIYFAGETAKVIKMETNRLQRRKKLPGQVSAEADSHVLPSVKERAFAKTVYGMPKEVKGHLFLHYFRPVTEKYEFIRIHLEHVKRSRFCDVIRLYDDRHIPLADGMHWKLSKQKNVIEFQRHHKVLYNSADEPLCVCKRERKKGERTFIFYSRHKTPSHDNGSPHIQEKLNGECYDFYAWFRMRLSRNGEVRLVYAWTSASGSGDAASFEPLYKLVRPHNKKRTLALQSFEDDGPYAVFTKSKEEGLSDCSIAPGVDPGFALCIAACLDQVPL